MKPIDPPEHLRVWILVSLSSSGIMNTHNQTSLSAAGLFPGYFINLEDAQQEQMLLALKGLRAHVFQLDFPLLNNGTYIK